MLAIVLLVLGLVGGGAAGAFLGGNRVGARLTGRVAARLTEVAGEVRATTSALDAGNGDVEPVHARRSDPEYVGSLVAAVSDLQGAGTRALQKRSPASSGYADVSISLARRSETLVQRQLNIIEQMELDPANKHLLDDLFRLDHLVTRMRRINTNTMVLSRASVSRTYSAPLELSEVLFGALAGIEQYQRITVSTDLTRHVRGSVAGDLMGLLTELIDNAAAFSPPATPVVVTAVEGPGGAVVVRVADRGLGMNPEDLEAFEARKRSSDFDDLATVRRVGLMVVARLAGRHDVDVDLQVREEGIGTLAKVVVPAKHLVERPVSVKTRPPSASTEVFRERVPAGTPASRALAPGERQATAPVPVGGREPEPVALPARVPGASPLSGVQVERRRQADAEPPVRGSAQVVAGGGEGWFAPVENFAAVPEDREVTNPSADALPVRRRPAGSTAHLGDATATLSGRYRSRWFSRPADGAGGEAAGTAADDSAAADGVAMPIGQDAWASGADAGWRVVDPATATPPMVDSTSGLPVREAGANLFPGSVSETAGGAAPAEPADPEGAARQPFVVRSRLGAYRRGVQQARGPAARPSTGQAWTVMQSSAATPPSAEGPADDRSFPTAVRTGT